MITYAIGKKIGTVDEFRKFMEDNDYYALIYLHNTHNDSCMRTVVNFRNGELGNGLETYFVSYAVAGYELFTCITSVTEYPERVKQELKRFATDWAKVYKSCGVVEKHVEEQLLLELKDSLKNAGFEITAVK
jgi:hypothetical protein